MAKRNPTPSIDEFQQLDELEKQLHRALRERDQARNKQSAIVEATYQAALEAVRHIKVPTVPSPKRDRRKKVGEVAVAVISDLQLAKVTPTYNSDICARRIEEYGDRLLKLAAVQRADHPVDELRVWLLGDIVEGEEIFAGQAHQIDSSLYAQVGKTGPEIICNFIRKMSAFFPRVKVTAVIGNHGSVGGRARRQYSPETNMDRLLYTICRYLTESDRVEWVVPDGPGERNWYAVETIGSRSWLLCHGDQFRWGVKSPSCEQKILGWATGAIPEHFDEVVCGHWHNMNWMSLKGGNLTLRVNGSTESYNTYAQEHVGSMATPMQWAFFVHPERGTTAEYKVALT